VLIFEIFLALVLFAEAFPDTTPYEAFCSLLEMSAKVDGEERGGGEGGGVVLRQASLPPREVSPIISISRDSSPLACAARRGRSPKKLPRAQGARRRNSISNAAAAWRAGLEDTSRGAVSRVRMQSRDASPRVARRSVPLPPAAAAVAAAAAAAAAGGSVSGAGREGRGRCEERTSVRRGDEQDEKKRQAVAVLLQGIKTQTHDAIIKTSARPPRAETDPARDRECTRVSARGKGGGGGGR
jgi:hypothetical protein